MIRYLVLFLVAACNMTAAGQASGVQNSLHVKLPADTLRISSGSQSNSVPLSALNNHDTLRIWDAKLLTLYTADDSLVLYNTIPFVPIVLEGPSITLDLIMAFLRTDDNLDERVAILREFASFGDTPVTEIGPFEYSSPDDSNLVRFREMYNLDSIAGHGSDESRAINLTRWVHTAVRHDGSATGPLPRNALNILKVCADSGRGINCRMMAIVLNEACLAVGLKSRYLTCLPQDKQDTEAHVVNMMWSDSLEKWLYMDPTYDGYFANKSGVLLSPWEVREALVNGDSLVVNDDLDYNGTPHDPVQYKSYMAKNLFRFGAPLVSEFNYESNDDEIVQVYLNPVGYDSVLTATADSATGTARYIKYYTDNATWFWEW
ncbi:MAG: transglutaminase-like domain-containing protein [bacterium]